MKHFKLLFSNIVSTPLNYLNLFGLNPIKAISSLLKFPNYLSDWATLTKQNKISKTPWKIFLSHPCLYEKTSQSGVAKGAYFFQDLIIAQRIFLKNPAMHVDVGSRIDGFVAHVASFRKIEVMDIRPLEISNPNIRFIQADLMNLDKNQLGAYESLSCLHAIEHFGLGRYGDPITINGHEIGIVNLSKLLISGGTLYLSSPLGPDRIEFNANRIISFKSILKLCEPFFILKSFSYTDDYGDLHDLVNFESLALRNSNFGCSHGCGIYEFVKK